MLLISIFNTYTLHTKKKIPGWAPISISTHPSNHPLQKKERERERERRISRPKLCTQLTK
jgi:hypothetical protein